MVCKYDDNITWSEVLGNTYPHSKDATYQIDTTLNQTQLIEMENQVFTMENKMHRVARIKTVNEKMDKIQEHYSNITDENAVSNKQPYQIAGLQRLYFTHIEAESRVFRYT